MEGPGFLFFCRGRFTFGHVLHIDFLDCQYLFSNFLNKYIYFSGINLKHFTLEIQIYKKNHKFFLNK